MTNETLSLPRVAARDLTGATRWLPDAVDAAYGLVFIAFRREQQGSIDSWAPWRAGPGARAGIVGYEVPVIGGRWRPVRRLIDAGMAGAVRELDARRRTLTIYGDVRRVSEPLGIDDSSTVWLFLVRRGCVVLDVVTGPYDDAAARRLETAVRRDAPQ